MSVDKLKDTTHTQTHRQTHTHTHMMVQSDFIIINECISQSPQIQTYVVVTVVVINVYGPVQWLINRQIPRANCPNN